MEKYTTPEIKFVSLDNIDIITSSGIELPEVPLNGGGIELPEVPLTSNKIPSF